VAEPLAVAATSEAGHAGAACVLDGTPRTDRLAERLGLDPAQPAPALIAAGYDRHGSAVLDLIDGGFALAVWAPTGNTALVARDRAGERPLFLAESAGGLLFASEVRNLLAALPRRPAPDQDALLGWLARIPLRDTTLYAGIQRVPPGHAVELGGGRWTVRRWWRPAARRHIATDDAAVAVRGELEAAVERAITGARRPALLLSGGIDSAAVATAAGDRIATCYSGVFPDRPAIDETQRLRRVRAVLGLTGVESAIGSGSALAGAAEFLAEWELPPASPNRSVWAPLYRRAADDGVDVLLTGDGGDELFGCARYLIADRIRSMRPTAAVRLAGSLPGMRPHPRPRLIARALLVYGVRGALPPALHDRLRAARGRSRGPDWLTRPARDDRWRWKRSPGPRWSAYLLHLLTDDPLGTTEQRAREGAMQGLRFRQPLLDPAMVEFAMSLPPELAFDGELDRPLLRRALSGELPDDILGSSRKPAFNALLESALAGPDRALATELITRPRQALRQLVDADRVAAIVRDLGRDGAPPALALDAWRIATAELWLRHHEDPGSTASLNEVLAPPHTSLTVHRPGASVLS
jgi:asparagine synthase (glutamine-hydrolysing)